MEFAFSLVQVVVIVLAIQTFGFLWYGPLLGKVWCKAMGIDMDATPKEEMKKKTFQHIGIVIIKVIAAGFLIPLVGANLFVFAFALWAFSTLPGILMGVVWENTPKPVAYMNLGAELVNLAIIICVYTWLM